ncbi:MAG: hypothetical protein HFJ06_03200 [Lachnospiraceae bacterium]|nr:hypothetical protein [Lachnospiraceae bacterium]
MDKINILKSEVKTLALTDGKEINLTLNFRKLLEVRNKRKELYKRYNATILDGMKDVFDVITILYTAYLCSLDDIDTGMTEESFMEKVPPYVYELNQIARDLTTAKKPEASGGHLGTGSQSTEEK